jgi:hypothetical protein
LDEGVYINPADDGHIAVAKTLAVELNEGFDPPRWLEPAVNALTPTARWRNIAR